MSVVLLVLVLVPRSKAKTRDIFWVSRQILGWKTNLVVFGGSRGFRKLREAGRIHFLQVSSKSELVGPSYDEKN